MHPITVEHNPSPSKLEVMGAYDWPIWSAEESEFPWTYEVDEVCYILSGEVEVTPEQDVAVTLRRGDLVSFPAGLRCTWRVITPIKKHYRLG